MMQQSIKDQRPKVQVTSEHQIKHCSMHFLALVNIRHIIATVSRKREQITKHPKC